MEIKRFIQQLRADLRALLQPGESAHDAAALDSYLAALEDMAQGTEADFQRAHEAKLEHYKATRQADLAKFTAGAQLSAEQVRAVVTMGQGALRSAMLVNGGAAVALLAFLGNAWIKGIPDSVKLAAPLSMWFFTLGLLCAAIASGGTYLSQEMFGASQQRQGYAMRALVVILMIVSYALFALGAWIAYSSFPTG